jgi:hypothetical protein
VVTLRQVSNKALVRLVEPRPLLYCLVVSCPVHTGSGWRLCCLNLALQPTACLPFPSCGMRYSQVGDRGVGVY